MIIKLNIPKEKIRKLHQLHGDDIKSITTVEAEDGVWVEADTALDEASFTERISKFNPVKDKRDVLKEKIKNDSATLEERVELCERLLGIRK